jgi:hypothetical protein
VSLTLGTRLGPYEVTAQIGTGGMGEVYRARDTKLGRDVAIKVLPDAFAYDADRLARFMREARTLALLNHPNIAHIHGLEESDGVNALVMEFVEGDDLSQHIARGAIPIDEALPFAQQIAAALEAAHEQAIVHRDLKPANIRITPAGVVKVLDFGLAKAVSESSVIAASQSPTATIGGTREGAILGTAAYMSPEQARGHAVDKRADIWAFGCVLYEMLTGRDAFGGPTLSDTLAAILGRGPDLRALPADTPVGIKRLLKRCFEKDPKQRLRDIGEARIECADAGRIDDSAPDSHLATKPRAGKTFVYTGTALLVALAAGTAGSALYFRRASVGAPEMRLQIDTPGGTLTKFALSPDGRTLVFEATIDGRTQLWLRPLESEAAQPLPGTENGTSPFWSPDSTAIAFFADGQLKRIDVAGGPPVALVSAATRGLGATWSRDGSILFVPANTGPVYRVPAAGGKAAAATEVDPPQINAHWHPFALPDGRHFLFYALGTSEQRGVYVGSLDSSETHRLFDSDAEAVFKPPDLVLHSRQGALVAQRLDLKTWEPVGEPIPVAKAVATDFQACGCAAISSSEAGPIAYRAAGPQREFAWVDRRGNEVETVGSPDTARVGKHARERKGPVVGTDASHLNRVSRRRRLAAPTYPRHRTRNADHRLGQMDASGR